MKEELVYNVNVRLYGAVQHNKDSHSYLIGDTPIGTSYVLGTLRINIRNLTLQQLRPMLEYDKSGHMDRRSMLFQEARFLMTRLPNPQRLPDIYQYRLGFVKKDRSDFRLVPEEQEELPISEVIGAVDFFLFDLAIVPLTQLC
ncbi:hypothetical protein EON63_11105 [archaeon]|nr:MAG: hypothetical protein EON63_11105 [archaeon]